MKRIHTVQIGERLVGDLCPCYLIAEIGINHNGDPDMGMDLIRAAYNAGADAVKFQTWITEEIITHSVPMPEYQKNVPGGSGTQFDLIARYELSRDDLRNLAGYAREMGIEFLSTPEGPTCIGWLEELNVPAYKIGSPDLVNHPDLRRVAATGKPLLISTGMATMEEVEEAVKMVEEIGNTSIVLLQCTTAYPARFEDVNLRAMQAMRERFSTLVGYSDHTEGIFVPGLAVAAGACLLEKHFTLDRHLPGPDHNASLEPEELKAMVATVRRVEQVLGSPEKRPVEAEKEMRALARKYLVAARRIRRGEIITRKDIAIKRTREGIHLPTDHQIRETVGSFAMKDYEMDDPL